MNNPESIEREIAHAKTNLGRQLSEAEEKARAIIDWRTHYQRNPVPMLAAAAAAGFVLSSLIDAHGTTDQEQGPQRAMSLSSPSVHSAMENMRDALVAAASIKAAAYIEQWLPGFHQEFSRRQG